LAIIAPARAQARGALQFPDPVLDVVEVDHRDALQSGGIRAAELGEPVVVRAKDDGTSPPSPPHLPAGFGASSTSTFVPLEPRATILSDV
jgi:hypothetical protein